MNLGDDALWTGVKCEYVACLLGDWITEDEGGDYRPASEDELREGIVGVAGLAAICECKVHKGRREWAASQPERFARSSRPK